MYGVQWISHEGARFADVATQQEADDLVNALTMSNWKGVQAFEIPEEPTRAAIHAIAGHVLPNVQS